MSPVVVARPARVFHGWWAALAFPIIDFLTTGVRFMVGPFSLVTSVSLFLYALTALRPVAGGR